MHDTMHFLYNVYAVSTLIKTSSKEHLYLHIALYNMFFENLLFLRLNLPVLSRIYNNIINVMWDLHLIYDNVLIVICKDGLTGTKYLSFVITA